MPTILAAKGWTHVEQKLTKQVLLQRSAAATRYPAPP